METITMEFDAFLKELIKFYYNVPIAISKMPSTLVYIGMESRDFNEKSGSKIKELIAKNPFVSASKIKLELLPIQVKYHSILLLYHFQENILFLNN
jgi:hypothetical protein